jgi:hypothetical protein
MRLSLLAPFVSCLATPGPGYAEPQKQEVQKAELHVENLAKNMPTGRLKLPLDTVVQVTCRSFSPTGEEARMKDDFWNRQVEIIALEGKPLVSPVRIEWAKLPYVSPEKPPLGTTLEVLGYEAGSFRGVPNTSNHRQVPVAAGIPFTFHSEFYPLKEIRASIQQR